MKISAEKLLELAIQVDIPWEVAAGATTRVNDNHPNRAPSSIKRVRGILRVEEVVATIHAVEEQMAEWEQEHTNES